MRRLAAAFLAGGVLGTALGVAVGFLAFPYVFAPPPATEALSSAERAAVVARGTFIHADPSDPVHHGRGGVSVSPGFVFLEEDFEVGPGPAFHVYLAPKARVRSSADVAGTMFVDLGRLRAFAGSQKYPVPQGVDPARYPSVVIWCAEFDVLISPADLAFGSGP